MPPPTPTPQRRLTLATLMVIIAVVSVPLAIVHRIHRAVELERHRARLAHLAAQLEINSLAQREHQEMIKQAKRRGATAVEIDRLDHARERLQQECDRLRVMLDGLRQ